MELLLHSFLRIVYDHFAKPPYSMHGSITLFLFNLCLRQRTDIGIVPQERWRLGDNRARPHHHIRFTLSPAQPFTLPLPSSLYLSPLLLHPIPLHTLHNPLHLPSNATRKRPHHPLVHQLSITPHPKINTVFLDIPHHIQVQILLCKISHL